MSRNPNSLAVEWFLEKYGFSSPETGIRALAERLAQHYGEGPPPFDPAQVAYKRKVNEILVEPIGREAVLIPTGGGFKIKINSKLPRVRRRFALAHELGHTYFFNIESGKPFRPYRRSGADLYEERLCEVFAGELLMPEHSFSVYLQQLGEPSLNAFFQLRRTYDVSDQCAAIRIADSRLWNVAIVAWQFRSSVGKDKTQHTEKMRVIWSSTPKGCFVPPGDSVKPSSIICRSYDSGEQLIVDEEKISLGSIRGLHRIECQLVNIKESPPTVISLIHLDSLSR